MSQKKIILLKIFVWCLCLYPLAEMVYLGLNSRLGANPIEYVTLKTGTFTLVFLLSSLAITPLRKLTGKNWLIRFRRLIGLFAFFYAFLHFLIYIVFDQELDLTAMFNDVAKRPFITAGFLAFVLLVPLAATSTAWSIRKLGGKRWNALHKLVYISAIAGVVHYWWKVKSDITSPAVYAAILTLLLGFRLFIWLKSQQSASARIPSSLPK
ncbi:MAG TPA: protein-methionine-sulfoxide reductase heme-binding subunit MsrQ [Terriglobales bacterium]|nr:protein-methionine-sulfoxide reductase heme-binding subunit MsrQ [Terriglobales bacterium]